MAAQSYDAIIIGSGIGGGTCAYRLRNGGMRVALIERERIGGETARWASIPSATLLGPANLLWRMREAAGAMSPSLAGAQNEAGGLVPQDELLEQLSDEAQIAHLRHEGMDVYQGSATITEPGVVEVGEQTLKTERIVIATGSEPFIPAIEGLANTGYWTAREAISFTSLPQHVVILSGMGTHAIELAQMFRMYSSEVTLVTSAERLIPAEDPEVGELMAERLHQSAVRVLLGRTAQKVEPGPEETRVVTLDDGSRVQGQVLVIAIGRTPRVSGLGLERLGIQMAGQGIRIDPHCRAAAGIWAIGDATGAGSYIHLAQYQARIAADDILGRPHPAFYTSVPRIAFTDPLVAATGVTLAQARERGINVATITVDLSHNALIHPEAPTVYAESRLSAGSYKTVDGKMALHADRERGTLIGAWAIAPNAGDWIQYALFAIRTETSLPVLHDMFEQFPTFSEVYLEAIERLMA
jgi:pyruvate/2-oxoglutarate dehydrogenase complex dihydrolipoamide dehydrogenase (E3) component